MIFSKKEKDINPDTSNAILRDLNEYFSKATPDNPDYNQGLARTIIVRYGKTVIVEGFAFAWIGDFLQRQPSMLALTNALNQAPNLYGYVFDFVSARGTTEAQAVLAAIIQTSRYLRFCRPHIGKSSLRYKFGSEGSTRKI